MSKKIVDVQQPTTSWCQRAMYALLCLLEILCVTSQKMWSSKMIPASCKCRREGFPCSNQGIFLDFWIFSLGQGQFCSHGSIYLVAQAVWRYNFFKDRQKWKWFLQHATTFFPYFADSENPTQFNHLGPTKTLRDCLNPLPVTNVKFSKFRSCASDVVTNECHKWERHGRRRGR